MIKIAKWHIYGLQIFIPWIFYFVCKKFILKGSLLYKYVGLFYLTDLMLCIFIVYYAVYTAALAWII